MIQKCAVPICEKEATDAGFCHSHYGRKLRLGNVYPDIPIGKLKLERKPINDITGVRFGRLVVQSMVRKGPRNQWHMVCKCDCGNIKTLGRGSLTSGSTVSCGCYRNEVRRPNATKHGYYNTPTYRSWRSMITRCLPADEYHRENYFDLGVTICPSWYKFENFLADMGERPEGMTLDRINPFGNYEPSNCRWADARTQSRNTRKRYLANQANPKPQGD